MPVALSSKAFRDGDEIPVKFTAYGNDVSPELSWSDPPAKTVSFALVMQDRDAKRGSSVHWVVWNLPATARALPEGVTRDPVLPDGTCQGLNGFNKVGYSGPRLAQVTEHSYVFTLYALDSKLNLKAGSRHVEFKALMGGHGGHVLAETQLVGRFKPERDDARVRALGSDKEYVYQSDEITRKLEDAYNARPQQVVAFFRRFSLPSAFAAEKIRELLASIEDEKVRRSLEDYVKFANHFRVQLRLTTNPLKFKTLVLPSYGTKFHVKIVGDHLEAGAGPAPSEDEPFRDSFAANDLLIPKAAQELIDKGEATFTQIDDGPEYSILKDLETFAYKDDGVAFFVHNAEQPYLGCIFGEKITKQFLHDLGPTITEFQKKHFSRASGGRPPDMDKQKRMLVIDRKEIPNKAKADELAEGGGPQKVNAHKVDFSRLKAKKRKNKRRR